MGLSEFFGFLGSPSTAELPELFPTPITQSDFVRIDVATIYAKILTDVLDRTSGLTDEQQSMMWDNCLKSSANEGLVSLLATAMALKQDLFLVVDAGILRKATGEEQNKIRADYEKVAKSSVGIFISFKKFSRADMVSLYSALDYCTVSSLYKALNVAKAVQLKFSDMRASTANVNASILIAQAEAMSTAMAAGKSLMMDAKDEVSCSTPDLEPVKESIAFNVQKMAFYLGMPTSYLTGEQTSGIGSTGEQDSKAVERGLKAYYQSVMKPVLEALFGAKLSYKSQDFRQILSAVELLKTFSLIDEEFVSRENKTKIVNALLDLPEDAKGDPTPKVTATPAGPGQKVPGSPPARAGAGE